MAYFISPNSEEGKILAEGVKNRRLKYQKSKKEKNTYILPSGAKAKNKIHHRNCYRKLEQLIFEIWPQYKESHQYNSSGSVGEITLSSTNLIQLYEFVCQESDWKDVEEELSLQTEAIDF